MSHTEHEQIAFCYVCKHGHNQSMLHLRHTLRHVKVFPSGAKPAKLDLLFSLLSEEYSWVENRCLDRIFYFSSFSMKGT